MKATILVALMSLFVAVIAADSAAQTAGSSVVSVSTSELREVVIGDDLLERSAPLVPDRTRHNSPLALVRTYLKTNVNESVPTWDVARMSGLGASQAIRAFHYEFGLPPHAYHLRVRLAAACELLTRGVAIARVANECGFADQSHLNRWFKSVYGVTPATWAAGSGGGRGHDAGVSARAIDARPKLTSVSFQRTARG